MEQKRIRISQCMIVKNEEKNIERALSWGKEIMWEQIVVDTGSTDRTVEIAEALGARVCTFPWINDFATAKNFAIEQCSGQWIALLDADEYMAAEDLDKLVNIIEDLDSRGLDGLSTGWQQLNDEGEIFSSGTQVRFFRNLPDIRYRRRIHEQLESTAGRELRLGDAVKELSIFHTGYQGQDFEEKKKSGRNRKLILEELKENPGDYEMMGYMGDECLGDGDQDEAREWYERSIKHMPPQLPDNDQRSAVTFTRLLMLLSEEEKMAWAELEAIYSQAVSRFPREADFDYAAGRFFATRGHAEQAITHLETAIGKLEQFGCSNKALYLAGDLLGAYDLLTRCCFEAGESEKCMTYGVTCLKYDRYAMAVLSRLLQLLAPAGTVWESQTLRQILEFFSRIYDYSSLKDRLFLVKTAQMAGCTEFAEFAASSLFTPEERKQLKL